VSFPKSIKRVAKREWGDSRRGSVGWSKVLVEIRRVVILSFEFYVLSFELGGAFLPEAAKMIRQKTADQRRQTEKKLIAFIPEAAIRDK